MRIQKLSILFILSYLATSSGKVEAEVYPLLVLQPQSCREALQKKSRTLLHKIGLRRSVAMKLETNAFDYKLTKVELLIGDRDLADYMKRYLEDQKRYLEHVVEAFSPRSRAGLLSRHMLDSLERSKPTISPKMAQAYIKVFFPPENLGGVVDPIGSLISGFARELSERVGQKVTFEDVEIFVLRYKQGTLKSLFEHPNLTFAPKLMQLRDEFESYDADKRDQALLFIQALLTDSQLDLLISSPNPVADTKEWRRFKALLDEG